MNFRRITIFLTSLLLILNSTLANTATIRAWTLSNPMAVGASILYDGSKGAVTSSVLITPNASQVAKVLRGGIAGYALTFAVDELLDGIDWVMDSANNRIVYKEPTIYPSGIYSTLFSSGRNPVAVCKYAALKRGEIYKSYFVSGTSFTFYWISGGGWAGTFQVAPPEQKNLPLETVAQKVIENAENNNLDAQFAVLAAANNILSEAEQDDAKAKTIEEDLERNSKKCPNGESRNIYGQCWICSAAEKQPIESNKNIAKVRAQALGSCVTGSRTKIFKNFDKDEFLVRATAWDTLADARDMENMCWLPKHPQHVEEAQINRKIAETCRAGAAQAIK